MFLLSHIHLPNIRVTEAYLGSGLLYPDIYIISPTIGYERTHFINGLGIQNLRWSSQAMVPNVRQFALGMTKHVRDDRRLPVMAQMILPFIGDIVGQVREVISKYVEWTPGVEDILIQDIAAGVIEYGLAYPVRPFPLQIRNIEWTLRYPPLVAFIADLWDLDTTIVTQHNQRWIEFLGKLLQGDTESLAELELRGMFSKLVASHLIQRRFIGYRDTVLVRNQIELVMDTVCTEMQKTRFALLGKVPEEVCFGMPGPARSLYSRIEPCALTV